MNSTVTIHVITKLTQQSESRKFYSWSGRYQVVTIRMGDCLRTGNILVTPRSTQPSIPLGW